jgi:hypothetical protein
MRVKESPKVLVFLPFFAQVELVVVQPVLQVILLSVATYLNGISPARGVGWAERLEAAGEEPTVI